VRPEPKAQPGGELLPDADAAAPLQDAAAAQALELPVAPSQRAPLEMAGAGRKVFDRAWEPWLPAPEVVSREERSGDPE